MTSKVKKIASRAVLTISFLPYLALLAQGIYAYINGFGFLNDTSYGLGAAVGEILFYGVILTALGVIPVCAAVQIAFLVHRKAVKSELRDKDRKLVTVISCVLLLIAAALFAALIASHIF